VSSGMVDFKRKHFAGRKRKQGKEKSSGICRRGMGVQTVETQPKKPTPPTQKKHNTKKTIPKKNQKKKEKKKPNKNTKTPTKTNPPKKQKKKKKKKTKPQTTKKKKKQKNKNKKHQKRDLGLRR